MSEGIAIIVEGAVLLLIVSSVVVIVGGLLVIFGSYWRHFRQLSAEENYRRFKSRLARVLMVALEILIVADVIETVTLQVTFDSLAALGLLVVVRTWLSWTLDLEAEGRWPWQQAVEE